MGKKKRGKEEAGTGGCRFVFPSCMCRRVRLTKEQEGRRGEVGGGKKGEGEVKAQGLEPCRELYASPGWSVPVASVVVGRRGRKKAR